MTNPLDEASLIAGLRRFATHPAALQLDDDAAVFDDGLVVTNDMLIEDVDFRRATFSAEDIGYKALAENLSDLAAMGATPSWFVQSIAAPSRDAAWIEGIARGVNELATRYGCALVGGDLSSSPSSIIVSITAAGRAGPRVLRRRRAQVGDRIFVGAPLGDAAAGLWLLEHGGAGDPHLLLHQRRPEPQVALGQWLAQVAGVTSAMDVSDGLAADLPRLLPRGLGAVVTQLPVSAELRTFAQAQQQDPHLWALRGGEDFCLLFTVATDVPDSTLRTAPTPLFEIGLVDDSGALVCNLGGTAIAWPKGFDHFAPPTI